MKKCFIVALVVSLAGVLLFFAGCGSTNDPTAPAANITPPAGQNEPAHTPTGEGTPNDPNREPTEFRYTRVADLASLNQHANNAALMADVFAWVHSGLYRRVPSPCGTTSMVIPDIASDEPFTVDAEGLVWHIPIRTYAVFSNGTPINAHTFEYSWKMLLDPLLVNSMTRWHDFIVNARAYNIQEPPTEWEEVGIRAVDDYTIEITTIRPFRVDEVMFEFLDRSTMPVYIEFYEAGMNEDRTLTTYGTLLQNWMGAGPFFFDTWTPNAVHVYRRNPDHWLADFFHYDTVTARYVPDPNARLQLWESGEIDMLSLTAAQFAQFADDPRLKVTTTIMPTHIDINNLNDNQPILQTEEFRRALYWAIDRGTISGIINQPPTAVYIGPEAGAFFGDGTRFRDTPQGRANVPQNHGFDPARARAYFDAAMEQIDADSVTIEYLFSEAVENQRLVGEFLQQNLPLIFGEGRFELVLRSAPAAGIGAMRNWRITTDWDITIVGWNSARQRYFPHQAFMNKINPNTRPNPYMTDDFMAVWDDLQEMITAIPIDYQRVIDRTAELEALWLRDAINVPVWQNVGHTLFSEHLELPLTQFVPAIEYGFRFGSFRQ